MGMSACEKQTLGITVQPTVLTGFLINLTQSKAIWEDSPSAEKMPSPRSASVPSSGFLPWFP